MGWSWRSGVLPARLPALTGPLKPSVSTLLRSRFIDRQTTALELVLIERGARRLTLRPASAISTKANPRRLTGGATRTRLTEGHLETHRRKQRFEFLFSRFERKVSYIQLH